MSDFKERLKLIMDTEIMLTIIVGVALSFPIMAISIKIKEISISPYSYIYIPLIVFHLYYNRYSHMMNFSVTRDEYFKIGQGLNLILSLLMWLMYLLAAFVINKNIQVSTMILVFIGIIFFTSLSNVISLLMINSSFIAFVGFGAIFGLRYVSRKGYFDLHNTMINIIFIILTILCSLISRYILKNIDFKLREVK
ncbi:hypothetical protein [Clostridium peptidivorans]|uniref:hypothetical protein n=1 Tax=Clostridium peptidivorans TaxID=100174 RepID=UPI000BE2D5A6|nr:hypothetical protein [Clostridium peptidivorans]